MEDIITKILLGNSKEVLKTIEDNSIDLIVTSPPYADRRKKTYGGVDPKNYVEWFLPISEQLLRVLKSTGTFILNIKEKAESGERSIYVLELILALRKQGWIWTEEFIWHKKNCYPGKWPNRFRDSWERILQFNKTRNFNMYQEEVMVPIGNWANERLKKLSEIDKTRDTSKSGLIGTKSIQQMCCSLQLFATIKIIVRLSQQNCQNGSLSYSLKKMIGFWTHF